MFFVTIVEYYCIYQHDRLVYLDDGGIVLFQIILIDRLNSLKIKHASSSFNLLKVDVNDEGMIDIITQRLLSEILLNKQTPGLLHFKKEKRLNLCVKDNYRRRKEFYPICKFFFLFL